VSKNSRFAPRNAFVAALIFAGLSLATGCDDTVQDVEVAPSAPSVPGSPSGQVTPVPQAPESLSYSSNPGFYVAGIAIPANAPSVFGGAAASYSIAPSLPAGLVLDSTTGILSGTPTATTSATAYFVTASNSLGSVQLRLTIEVDAGTPLLIYPANPGGQVGQALNLSPSTLAADGAALTTCAIKAGTTALPGTLSVNPATCAITGTPAALLASTTFTVEAGNSVGNSDATVTLTIGAGPPALSYAGASGTTGQAGLPMSVSPTSLIANGAAVTGCAIQGGTTALPPGLSVNSSTCVISGTPSISFSATTFTLVATNSAGTSAAATVQLTVSSGLPSLGYAGASGTTGTVGQAMTVTPTILATDGSSLTGCGIKNGTTALPAGLSVNTSTCVISGTPSAVAAPTTFTLVATNSVGSSPDATVQLTINAGAPVLSYAGSSGTASQAGVAVNVTPTTLNANGAAISACATKGGTTALPTGLSVNPSTCVISGTTNSISATTTYTLDATNSAGTSSDATVQLTFNSGPPTLSYAGATGTSGESGQPMTVSPTTLANDGAPVTGCAIKGGTTALPTGLSVNATSCVISGTPTVTSGATTYTLVATNPVGTSSSATVQLTVGSGPPTLDYTGATGTTGEQGQAMSVSPTSFSANGSALTGCAIQGGTTALPTGLAVDPASCVISGTPTTTAGTATYTVIAANSVGNSASATVVLTVNAGPPTLSYAGATGTTGQAGQSMNVAPTTFNTNGAALTSCGIKTGTTSLPSGLTVAASTCAISGIPASPSSTTTYTLIAINSVGASANETVSLTVNAGPPTLSYVGAGGTSGIVGDGMVVSPTTLLNRGAAITGCALDVSSPALPAGLAINPTTCVISGTLSAPSATTTYSIVATNSVGNSADATVQLTSSLPLPSVTSILPVSGAATGGTAVEIDGTNFVSGVTVLIGGTACTGINVINSTTIDCTTAASFPGVGDVVVSDSGGTGTLSGGYTYTGPTTFTVLQNQIFLPNCLTCHGGTAGFSVDDYSTYFGSFAAGPRVIAGDAADSYLIGELLNGDEPEGASPLSTADINAISDWINAGALDN
jgi:hypothetical protein